MCKQGGAALKWRFWVACGMLVLILCAGLLTQRRIETLCGELCRLLQQDTVEVSFPRAYAQWKEHVTVLSVLIHHDRIDTITESFARAEAFLKDGTGDEYRAEAAQLISKLTWLKEYDRPSFRSIF